MCVCISLMVYLAPFTGMLIRFLKHDFAITEIALWAFRDLTYSDIMWF